MSAVRQRDHYHFVTLPSGRRVRSDKQSFDDVEIGTGWSFGKLRVTTSDVKALRNAINTYVDENGQPSWGNTWLATYGKNPEMAANIEADAYRLLQDDEAAAETWSKLSRDQRNWLRNKFNKKGGILRDIASVATTAAGSIAGGLIMGPAGALIGAKKGAKAGEKFSSLGSQVLATAAPIAGKAAGAMLGGPVGASIGSALGNAVGGTSIDPMALASGAAQAAGIDTSIIQTAKDIIKSGNSNSKALLKSIAPQVKQAIKDVRASDLNKAQAISKIASVNAPIINKVVSTLQKQALQQQATSEHKKRNKVNKVLRDNSMKQDAIINELRNLKSLVAGKTKAQQTVAAAFGVPLVYTV